MYRNISRICNINIKGAKESIQCTKNNSLLKQASLISEEKEK